MRMKRTAADVFVPDDGELVCGAADIGLLTQALPSSPRRRARICWHASAGSPLQEMVIAFAGDSDVQPARHRDKAESLLVMQGRGEYMFFDVDGALDARVPLLGASDAEAEAAFYVRIPRGRIHALVPGSTMLAKETTSGPFRPSETELVDATVRATARAQQLATAAAAPTLCPTQQTRPRCFTHRDLTKLIARAQAADDGCASADVSDAGDVVIERFVARARGSADTALNVAGGPRSLHAIVGAARVSWIDDGGEHRAHLAPLSALMPASHSAPASAERITHGFAARLPDCAHGLVVQVLSDVVVMFEAVASPAGAFAGDFTGAAVP